MTTSQPRFGKRQLRRAPYIGGRVAGDGEDSRRRKAVRSTQTAVLQKFGNCPRTRVLTTREREILKFLAEGKTVRSVATLLGLSIKTVDAHKFNLMRKLGIHNKAELVMWAIQKKVVKVPVNL